MAETCIRRRLNHVARLRIAVLAVLIGFVALSARADDGPDTVEATWQSYRAHIAAAQALLELNEAGRAREWTDNAPPAHRGWEWRHLRQQLDASLDTVATDSAGFMSVSVAPDDARVACLTGSGRLTIIALPGRAPIRSWDAHPEGGGFTVRFSPDGKRVASSGADRLVKIWDAATGELILTFDQHKFPVGGLAWSPDGSEIASSAYYMDKETPIVGRVHVWSTRDGAVRLTLSTGRKPVVCTDWSRDGRYIAVGTWDSEAVVWSAADGTLVRTINEQPDPDSSSHVEAIALSPDGELLAYGSDRRWIRVHRITSGERVAELLSHNQPVAAVRFSPDGARLATGGGDDTIRIWNTTDWRETATLRGHSGRVRGLAFSQDGVRLYSAGLDGDIRAWDPAQRDSGGLRMAHAQGNYAVSFSQDGALLVGAGYDGVVPLWDARTGELRTQWSAHAPSPVCMTEFSPDGARVATCSWDKTARVWDISTQGELLRMEHAAGVAYLAWGPRGDLLATACNDKLAHLWNARTGELVRSLSGHEAAVSEVRFSPDGKLLLSACNDRTARIWDVASGECLRVLAGHDGGVLSAGWSPDGRLVVTATKSGEVRTWRAATGELERVLLRQDEAVHRVAFSPDGSRIACASREVILLDPRRAGVVARLRPHREMAWNLMWSPDGARLASGSWDGTVVILSAGVADTIRSARR